MSTLKLTLQIFAVSALSLGAAGCFSIVAGGTGFRDPAQTFSTGGRSGGITRAAFDLQCPVERVQATTLQQAINGNGRGAIVGVRGCDKQASYMYVPEQSGWLLNSAIQEISTTAPAQSPSNAPPAAAY